VGIGSPKSRDGVIRRHTGQSSPRKRGRERERRSGEGKEEPPQSHLATRLTNAPELSAASLRGFHPRNSAQTGLVRKQTRGGRGGVGGERRIPRERKRRNGREKTRMGRGRGRGGTVGGEVSVVKFSGLYFPRSAGETPPEFHSYHFLPTMPPPLPLAQKGRLTRKLALSFTPGVKVKSAR